MPPAYRGSCHCGAVGFVLQTGLAPDHWSIRACQCSFCRAHGAESMSDRNGEIRFAIKDATRLQRYRFGLQTADFLLCQNCGVYIGAVIATERGPFGIVNVRALCERPEGLARAVPVSYDGEDSDARAARREEKWMRVMRMPGV